MASLLSRKRQKLQGAAVWHGKSSFVIKTFCKCKIVGCLLSGEIAAAFKNTPVIYLLIKDSDMQVPFCNIFSELSESVERI